MPHKGTYGGRKPIKKRKTFTEKGPAFGINPPPTKPGLRKGFKKKTFIERGPALSARGNVVPGRSRISTKMWRRK